MMKKGGKRKATTTKALSPSALEVCGEEQRQRLYFEQQVRMHCAVHATNNFLQERVFSCEIFDDIIKRDLPKIPGGWLNPYKSSIPGVGNYDVSVVLTALKRKNLVAQQFDKRHEMEVSATSNPEVMGAIVVTTSKSFRGMVLRKLNLSSPRHFVCLRCFTKDEIGIVDRASVWDESGRVEVQDEAETQQQLDESCTRVWLYFDSKYSAPRVVGSDARACDLLNTLRRDNAEIFFVSSDPDTGHQPTTATDTTHPHAHAQKHDPHADVAHNCSDNSCRDNSDSKLSAHFGSDLDMDTPRKCNHTNHCDCDDGSSSNSNPPPTP